MRLSREFWIEDKGDVFVECGAFYKADGPDDMRVIGETEFVNGVAAMSASGLYGDFRACAGIVSRADLVLGDAVTPVLEAHMAAGGGRFRGIRNSASFEADKDVLGPLNRVEAGLYLSSDFRKGFARLAPQCLMRLTPSCQVCRPPLSPISTPARSHVNSV